MADESTRIIDITNVLTKDNDTVMMGDNANQGTGKFSYSSLKDWVKEDLNLQPSDVGLANVNNVQQASKSDFDSYTNGTALKHDASAITFNASTVYNELLTLKNRLNDSLVSNNKDIHIVIIDYAPGDAQWTEAQILALIGIDNANYTNFQYRIDQRFQVYAHELNKVIGHATNVNIPTDYVDIAFEVTNEGNYHLTNLKINDNVFTTGNDYRVSFSTRIYKEYFTPTT